MCWLFTLALPKFRERIVCFVASWGRRERICVGEIRVLRKEHLILDAAGNIRYEVEEEVEERRRGKGGRRERRKERDRGINRS